MRHEHDERSSELARRLRVALAWQDGLPARDITSVEELVDAGELTLALETLCTQLFEFDVDLDASLRLELDGLGGELGVDVAHLLGDPWAPTSWERRDDPPT